MQHHAWVCYTACRLYSIVLVSQLTKVSIVEVMVQAGAVMGALASGILSIEPLKGRNSNVTLQWILFRPDPRPQNWLIWLSEQVMKISNLSSVLCNNPPEIVPGAFHPYSVMEAWKTTLFKIDVLGLKTIVYEPDYWGKLILSTIMVASRQMLFIVIIVASSSTWGDRYHGSYTATIT